MANRDSNIYYHPEKHQLENVVDIEYSDLNYCFDTRVVWRHTETGVLYTARDSGCSCPYPFEDYNGVAELERFDADEILAEIEAAVKKSYQPMPADDAARARAEIRALT